MTRTASNTPAKEAHSSLKAAALALSDAAAAASFGREVAPSAASPNKAGGAMHSAESLELIIPPEIRQRARRRRWIGVVLLCAAALGGAVAYFAPKQVAPQNYRTALVERRTIVRVVEAAGNLEVLQRAEVLAPSATELVEILVREGDSVTAGQVLARVDERAARIGVRGAQAGLAAAASRIADATAALEAATDTRERTERLLGRGLASESELKAAQAAEARARAALQAARAERTAAQQSVKSAELSESLSLLAAPIAGVVLRAPATLGAAVRGEGVPLFVIGSPLETLRIDAEVAESEIGEVKVGQAAHFTVPAFSQGFEARVEHVGVDAQRSGNAVRYPIRLRVENPGLRLLPGMTTSVKIDVATAENVLATREAALRFLPESADEAPPRSRVFRLRGGRVEPVPVVAELSDGAYTEIRPVTPEDLAPGTEVVVGRLDPAQRKSGGAGIRLGNR